MLGETGTVNLNDPKIIGLTSTFYSDTVGWIIAIVAIGLYACTALRGRQKRVSEGLSAPQVGLLVPAHRARGAWRSLVAVWVLNDDRGVPLAALILVGFCLAFFYLTTRTTFGRHIFAVGGNAEAARRAGIHVTRVRVIVFMIASTMAAIGGIMAASRLLAVNQSSGSGDFLLLAIAGPVIAGTSLFGGRGSVWHALLGALVITSISNGMDLLALAVVGEVHSHGGRAAPGRDNRRDRAPAATGGGTGLTPGSGEPLQVGLIGYGLAGSAFHAPLVEAVPGLSLTSIVTSDPERSAQARSAYPHVRILPSADDLFAAADAHDLAVIAAPNRHHVPLALRAVDVGLHLVVDKPLAANVADAQRLADAAEARGVVASVFHNRRWDGDFLTLRRLVSEGSLGDLVRLESRFDRWRPETDRSKWREGGGPEDAGGVLFDIGPHLIDQVLELLGPARSVYAEVRTGAIGRGGGRRRLPRARAFLWRALPSLRDHARRAAWTAPARARLESRVREVGSRRAGDRRFDPARVPAIPASARSRGSRGDCSAPRRTRSRSRQSRDATSSSTSGWSGRFGRAAVSRRPSHSTPASPRFR